MSARERLFWLVLAILLGFLAANKQLDLQTALTELGRAMALEQGWYEERRVVQVVLIGTLGVGAVAGVISLVKLLGRVPRATHLAILGLGVLGLFVVVRASSFHHMDTLIKARWLGIRANWGLEMGGTLTILAGAQWRRKRP